MDFKRMVCTSATDRDICKHLPPLGPEYQTAPINGTNAYLICAFGCFDNLKCKSFSWRGQDKTCQLFSKNLVNQGLKEQKSATRFSGKGCVGGSDIFYSDTGIFLERFNVDTSFEITPPASINNPNWELVAPGHCENGKSLRARPPLGSNIRLDRNMTLPVIGATYELRFEYLYENADSNNILLGYLFNTDQFGESLSAIPELARANDPTKQGIWQTKIYRFTSERVKKYRIQIDIGPQPFSNSTKRTQWRIDNLYLRKV